MGETDHGPGEAHICQAKLRHRRRALGLVSDCVRNQAEVVTALLKNVHACKTAYNVAPALPVEQQARRLQIPMGRPWKASWPFTEQVTYVIGEKGRGSRCELTRPKQISFRSCGQNSECDAKIHASSTRVTTTSAACSAARLKG